MNDTFMKEKPILPLILSMSLPMVLSMLVNSLYNIVDSFFVAQISEEAMTALSLVWVTVIIIYTIHCRDISWQRSPSQEIAKKQIRLPHRDLCLP